MKQMITIFMVMCFMFIGMEYFKTPLYSSEEIFLDEGENDSYENVNFENQIIKLEELQSEIEKKGALEDFIVLTDRVYKELPRKELLEGLTEEDVHHYPRVLKEAGWLMGLVVKSLGENPSFYPQARDFYHQCAFNSDILTPIRALCVARLEFFSNLYKDSYDEKKYSMEVVKLAHSLSLN